MCQCAVIHYFIFLCSFKAEAIQEAQRKIAELDALEESDAATED